MSHAYDTPDEAARSDIPEKYARTLAIRVAPDEQHAVVLLGIDVGRDVCEYQVVCERHRDRWIPGTGGNGPGWSSTTDRDDPGPNCGGLTAWGATPEHAAAASITYVDVDYDEPVTNGYYLFAFWDVPDDSIAEPGPVRFE
jgi:hypothetical protein